MEKIISLSVSDRFSICRHINLIPCTLNIRVTVDEFNDKFAPTVEDIEKSGAVLENGKITSIKDDFITEFAYTDVPEPIRRGIRDFIEVLESNKNAPKDYIETVTTPLKKVL